MAKTKRKARAQASKPRAKGGAVAAEIAGILLLALAAFLLVSLVSYDPADPSLFSGSSGAKKIGNFGGRAGAWLADIAFQVFGLAAFCVPFMSAFLGISAVMTGERKHIPRKAIVFLALFLILCPLLALFLQSLAFRGTRIPAGGLLGDILYSFLHGILNGTGTLIFLLAAAALFVVFATGFSFKKLFESIGRMFSFAFQEVRIKIEEPARAPKPGKPARPAKPEKKPAPEKAEKSQAAAPAPTTPAEPVQTKRDRRKDGPAELKTGPIKPAFGPPPKPEQLVIAEFKKPEGYEFPPLSLLDPGKPVEKIDKEELMLKKTRIEEKLAEFKVEGEVKEYHPGPVITTYEFYPNPGIKISQVAGLAEDLSLHLGAESVRIQRIPGKSSLGVEIPNDKREIIKLHDILASEAFIQSPSKLTFALGKTVHDEIAITDLAVMPHLLIAGATGTGKSVCLNALIASILYKATPEEVKLILIDPKRLEFTLYDGIPHLLAPVINDSKKAGIVLMDAVRKMEQRYKLLSEHKVRNIEQYNHSIALALKEKKGPLSEEEAKVLKPLPYIVIIIDELAELMMVSAQDVDYAIARLAQLARAVGIHLVLATQRPSIDVITGTIKNNFSSRIAFRVPSKIDSRVILDTGGADKLLGMGDMLFMPPNYPRLQRLHCAYVSIPEVRRLVKFCKEQGVPEYDERLVSVVKGTGPQDWLEDGEKDERYAEAVELILHTGQASASYLQRKLKLGYARASRIIDQMESEGLLGASEGSKPREILIDAKQWREQQQQQMKKKGGDI
jgi:DNA segregation ATPase FtsK/SpoIIIE, S-DNA-T family